MAPEAGSARDSARNTLFAMAAVALVSIAAYLPAVATGFTSDDFFILARVKALGGLAHPLAYFQSGFFDYYRPLTFLSQAVDWKIYGLHAAGFHLRNLLLHAGCAVLVFLIGRRLLSWPVAFVAAILFALHPASHEAVYWMAARFDLMATFFTLTAVWCLSDDRRSWRALGIVAFAMGLLSKESAISLVLIAPAWDVFIARRTVRSVVRRLLPLLVVVAVYAVVRSLGADLAAAGGGRRLMKAVMAGGMLAGILVAAWRRDQQPATVPDQPRAGLVSWPAVGIIGLALAVLLWLPATAAATARSLGFVAYVAFYSISPVVFPSPPAEWFAPMGGRDALLGFVIAMTLLAIVARFGRSLARHADAVFLCVFIAAALVPVSSMIGGLRYLYLATAGVVLLAGWFLERLPRRGRIPTAVLLTAFFVVSLSQLLHAAHAWRAGSDMTRDGIRLMADSPAPCGTRAIVLLTAPAGIGGVYANFLYEAFDVLTGCSPKSFVALLRVVDGDVHVDVTTREYGVVELHVPNYRGNIIASKDLSNFTYRIAPGQTLVMDTALGRLETFAEGSTQAFHLTLNDRARKVESYYYSDGAIRKPPRP
jgi:hypothetical protein